MLSKTPSHLLLEFDPEIDDWLSWMIPNATSKELSARPCKMLAHVTTHLSLINAPLATWKSVPKLRIDATNGAWRRTASRPPRRNGSGRAGWRITHYYCESFLQKRLPWNSGFSTEETLKNKLHDPRETVTKVAISTTCLIIVEFDTDLV